MAISAKHECNYLGWRANAVKGRQSHTHTEKHTDTHRDTHTYTGLRLHLWQRLGMFDVAK